jgi:hypothetical protein
MAFKKQVSDLGNFNLDAFLQQQRAALKPKKKQKDFWTDQISTGGGIAGALAGGAAGTAILPGIGTIIGALAGGALGGGGGEFVENKITKEKDPFKNVAQEAALNGVFGAGPLRLGSLAVRGGAALAKGAGKEALIGAGEKALADRPISNAIGRKLTGASDSMAVRSIGATPSQLTNFQKKFGEDMTSVLKRNKLVGKNLEDVTKLRSSLDEQFGNLVKGAGDISKHDLAQSFVKAYTPLLKSSSLDRQESGQALKQQAQAILKSIKGDTIPASKLNSVKSEFDGLVNYSQRAADPNKYGVNKKVADVLRGHVHNAPGADGLKETGSEISKLRQLEDVFQAQGNRGRGSNPLGLTTAILGTTGGTVGGLPGGVAAMAGARALNSQAGKRVATNTLEKIGGRLSSKATDGMNPAKVIKRVGLAGALTSIADQSSPGNTTDTMNQTTTMSNPAPMAANIGGLYQDGAGMSSEPSIGGLTQSQLEQGMTNAALDGNKEAFAELQSLYELLPQAASQKLNSTQVQQANNSQSGLNSLSTIAQILQQNPNAAKLASLPGGSFTQSITGTGEYQAAVNNATDVIGRLRSGGAINSDEEKRFRSLLPAAFDDEQTVHYKLSTLADLFERFSNPQAAQPDYPQAPSPYGA